MAHDGALPFWLVNVPRDQWPAACPDYLEECGEKDRGIIGTPDEAYRVLTWADVRELVKSGRIDKFHRKPSELRRYRQFTFSLVRDYGSILNFMLQQRLQWETLQPRGEPFEYAEDMKILYNDWPYGLDPDIIHLIVWTKFDLEDDAVTGQATAESQAQIKAFVEKTFAPKVQDYVWFKNWKSLKSVHAVEHFHIMLYKPDAAFLEHITNGDVPMTKKMAPA